ncbi:cysteine hydrolase family protein [Desulfosporosinus lacus]|uniref:Nicotinamidase-related amidase n=1 Tax=Desulfosporosinus lacus DSM 15449 TaxID=1121420 RepID=A0A1M6ETE7_9FIRM|nr:cysteine hydrolase family protein [Desulfosporosinus lacus]SHI88705.1 Nicotinamidase-related amidase [Desulfosporosinus lacus DSM 15449]
MKKILVVVDYQKDFVSGSLGFEKAISLETRIRHKIKQYKQNGDEVVFTFDTHNDNYLQTQEGKNLPILHCVRNTEGWNLYGKVAELCDKTSKRFEKITFGSLELATYLTNNEYDCVELIGVVSNICVISNAIIAKAALPEAKIIVDASCTASNDESLNQKALDVMQGMQIEIINR